MFVTIPKPLSHKLELRLGPRFWESGESDLDTGRGGSRLYVVDVITLHHGLNKECYLVQEHTPTVPQIDSAGVL